MLTKLKHILIGFLFFSVSGYSQTQKFIEVIASDTVTLKPTKFIYQITSGAEQMEFMGIKMPQPQSDDTEKKDTPSISEITPLLDKEKFNYTVSSETNYSISGTEPKPSITVILNGESELKRLYNTLKSQPGIKGKIKETFYEPLSNYQEAVYKRLYSVALTQATQLATISGSSIGKVLSISEMKNDTDNFMDVYTQMMSKMSMGGLFGENGATNKKEEIKMVFKFELK
jgi:hypothetical protein